MNEEFLFSATVILFLSMAVAFLLLGEYLLQAISLSIGKKGKMVLYEL